MAGERARGRAKAADARPGENGKIPDSGREPASFEAALGQLDEIVARLDDGRIPLDEALAAYERGVRLVQACQRMLDEADLRVERLRADIPGGNGVPDVTGYLLEAFDAEDE